eukprot:5000-Heterococcus_DN1.PRE.1
MEEPKRVSFSSPEPVQKKQSIVTFSRRYSMQNAKKTMSDAAVRLARIISRTQSGMPLPQLQRAVHTLYACSTSLDIVDANAGVACNDVTTIQVCWTCKAPLGHCTHTAVRSSTSSKRKASSELLRPKKHGRACSEAEQRSNSTCSTASSEVAACAVSTVRHPSIIDNTEQVILTAQQKRTSPVCSQQLIAAHLHCQWLALAEAGCTAVSICFAMKTNCNPRHDASSAAAPSATAAAAAEQQQALALPHAMCIECFSRYAESRISCPIGCDGSAVHPSVFSVLSEDVQCKYKRFTALDLAQAAECRITVAKCSLLVAVSPCSTRTSYVQ